MVSSTAKPFDGDHVDPSHTFIVGLAKAARPSSHVSPMLFPVDPAAFRFGASPDVLTATGPILIRSAPPLSLKNSPGSAGLMLIAACPSRRGATAGRLNATLLLNNWMSVVIVSSGCYSSGRKVKRELSRPLRE